MSGGDDASRLMMSPARQQLLDEVQELDGVSLKQANAIASELCTNIQFHVPAPHRLRRLNARPPPGDQRGAAESVLRGGAALHLVPSRPRVSESLLLKAAEAAGSREEVRQQPERDQELQPAAPSWWWWRGGHRTAPYAVVAQRCRRSRVWRGAGHQSGSGPAVVRSGGRRLWGHPRRTQSHPHESSSPSRRRQQQRGHRRQWRRRRRGRKWGWHLVDDSERV
mmetsp:Transcript_43397/g.80312  ORF Transcript_43397/g.80312 Transcript_43397/m.80312 type:complete len:223 (+) Transcript_43397:1238-1906(+)